MRYFIRYFVLFAGLAGLSLAAEQDIFVQQKSSVQAFSTTVQKGAANGVSNLLAVTTGKAIKLYDALTFSARATLPDQASPVTAIVFSPNGQSLVSASVDGTIGIWNASNGAFVKSISTSSNGIISLAVAGQNLILTAELDKTLKVIDAASGKTVNTASRLPEEIASLSLQPAGKLVAVALASGQIRLLTVPEFEDVRTLSDPTLKVSALTFSADGRYLVAGGIDGAARIWSTDTWTEKGKLGVHAGAITSISIDPENKWLATSSLDSTLKIFDFRSLALRKTVRDGKASFSFVALLNNETLCAGTTSGFIRRWQVLESPPDTLPPVISILEPQPTEGEDTAKVFGKEFTMQVFVSDQSNLKEVLVKGSPVSLKNVEAADSLKLPQGMQAKKFLAVVPLDTVGLNTVEVKAVDEFGNTAREYVRVERLSADEAVEILSPEKNSETDKISTRLQFKVWFEAASYEVKVNLLQMAESKSIAKLKPGEVISEDIPLVAGYNQIQIIVTGTSGEKVSKTLGVTRKVLAPISSGAAKIQPTERGIGPQRWAVVVGISEYANPGVPSLKFADQDAAAMAAFLEKPEAGGFDKDHIRLLLNQEAMLPNLRDALINFLSQAIDKDLVIIYFAGHGAPDPARPTNLYLLTYDSDPNLLGTTAFPMWQIQDVLARYISAKRIVVFSDACHSGGISVGFATRGMGVTETNPINQYLADLARSKEGIVVFTASAAGEVSQELPEFGHGVYTYYLLKGMEGEADLNNDYTVTINELMQYVEEQVKRKTKGAQNPTRSQTSYDKELPISLIAH